MFGFFILMTIREEITAAFTSLVLYRNHNDNNNKEKD